MAWIVLIYGMLIGVGGLIGHLYAGSIASLIGGGVSGSLLMIAALVLFKGKKWGGYLALLLALFLDGFFLLRYLKSYLFFPAGFLSLVSLGVFLYLAMTLRKKWSSG